jgi:predicted RNase H-like nuclease (RuvC/YqgF family)
MSKSLEEVLKVLDDDSREAVVNAIEAEKQRGIDGSRKKGDEVKKHIGELNRLRDKIRELEIDPDSDIDEQIESLKSKIKGGGGQAEWQRESGKMQRQLKELTDKLAQKEQREAELVKSSALSKAAGYLKGKAHAHEEVSFRLFHEGKIGVGRDGSSIVWKDGDEELDLDKGISAYLKNRPDIVINGQKGGGGSDGGGSTADKSMAQADWEKMEPKARANYIKDGGKII